MCIITNKVNDNGNCCRCEIKNSGLVNGDTQAKTGNSLR